MRGTSPNIQSSPVQEIRRGDTHEALTTGSGKDADTDLSKSYLLFHRVVNYIIFICIYSLVYSKFSYNF
jgi:hypothetical protein